MLLLFLRSNRSSSEDEVVSLLWMACFFTLEHEKYTGHTLTSALAVLFQWFTQTLYGFFLLGICGCQKGRGCSAFCSRALRKKTKASDPTAEHFSYFMTPEAIGRVRIQKWRSKRISKYQLEVLHISAQSSAASGCKAGHFLLPPLPLHPLRHLHRPLHLLRPPPPPLRRENLTTKGAVITLEIRILQMSTFKRVNRLHKGEADKDAASFLLSYCLRSMNVNLTFCPFLLFFLLLLRFAHGFMVRLHAESVPA